jgi:hypothetical protein
MAGWYGLLSIIKNIRQEEAESAQDWRVRPLCCPNDGTPLEETEDGVLFCPWDGWKHQQ